MQIYPISNDKALFASRGNRIASLSGVEFMNITGIKYIPVNERH